MTHRRALLLMVLVTLLWSTAGVVSRQLETARSLEVTFWRSVFTAITLLLWWGLREGKAGLRPLMERSGLLWASAICWACMFTAFMVALTLTAVANVLVVMALAPLFTAVLAWLALHQPMTKRTWIAVALAGCGVAWMFSGQTLQLGWGPIVALVVPVAAALNWTLLQGHARRKDSSQEQGAAQAISLPHAVAMGALISAAATLPWALPFAAAPVDVAWLALLGATQLAFPCVLLVHLTKILSSTEISLLSLLELVFGVAWVWLAGEAPPANTLVGAGLVLAALVLNELSPSGAAGANL